MILMIIVNLGLLNGHENGPVKTGLWPAVIGDVYEKREVHQRIQGDAHHSDQMDIVDYITEKAMEVLYQNTEDGLYRFTVTPRWLPGTLTRSTPDEIIDLQLKSNIERYTVFEVAYLYRNRRQSVEIQCSVDIERQLPVASDRIMNGNTIDERDIEMRWVSVTHDRGQLVSEQEEIIGKTIRRTVVPGQPIRYADISSDFLIEAGDQVQLIFENDGIEIQITVEARQSGAQDEEISFYSNESRKRYQGKISGPGVAIWTKTI